MLLASHALGYGAMWRTGALAFDRKFMRSLGLAEHEHIVGFLYIGSVAGASRKVAQCCSADYFAPWPAVDGTNR